MIRPQVVTASSGEIMELREAKKYLQISENVHSQDDEIEGMLQAARADAERMSKRTLRPSVTRVDTLSNWFRRYEFLYPPLHTTPAITVQYYDSSNSLDTVDSGDYFVFPAVSAGNEQEGPSWLEFDDNWNAPILYDRRPDRILITYTTGYVDQQSIPQEAKQAVKMLLWDIYRNNEGKSRPAARKLLGATGFGYYPCARVN